MLIETRFVSISLISLATALAASAPVIESNPLGVVAVADFPGFGTHKLTKGNVFFYSIDGKKVQVHVDVTGLPKEGGPFVYHIHQNAIVDGDCELAGLHFNPYGASPDNCDLQPDDSWCQVGDLSGKHGWIDTTCFEAKYEDQYLSLSTESPSNIIGRSVVFHYANMTKFACANIVLADEEQLAQFKENTNVRLAKYGLPVESSDSKPEEEHTSSAEPTTCETMSETVTESSCETTSVYSVESKSDCETYTETTSEVHNETWSSSIQLYESCSSEAQAPSIHGGIGLAIGALVGAII